MSGENELFLKHRVIIEQTWENLKMFEKTRIITVERKSFVLTFLCH